MNLYLKKGYNVALIDMRGHGQSVDDNNDVNVYVHEDINKINTFEQEYSLQSNSNDIIQIMKYLKELSIHKDNNMWQNKIILCGHSYGISFFHVINSI